MSAGFNPDWLRRIPYKPLWLITALCLLLREEFPFSNFPMYSSFGHTTYYVYVADIADQPLSSLKTLGVSTPTLKKMYATEVARELKELDGSGKKRLSHEDKRAPAERLLQRLLHSPRVQRSATKQRAGVRFYEVTISLEAGKIQKQSDLIAEVL